MITVYSLNQGRIVAKQLEMGEVPPEAALWIDMLNPTEHERLFVSTALGLDLPDTQEMLEIEVSSRLYGEKDALYLTIDILCGFDTPNPEVGVLLIVKTPKHLTTVRYCEPRAIQIFAGRLRNDADLFSTVDDGLLSLLDAITDRIADILETVGASTDMLSRQIFRASSQLPKASQKERQLQEILHGIGKTGDITHKIRGTINDMVRLTTFLGHRLALTLRADQAAKFHALESDLRSLNDHAQFMSHETTFLLDATLGQINIEQNKIIKIFSVVTVVFLPPTLFASMWGMNFHNIPELNWDHGYYMALAVMLISAILPLAYFKHRGWL